ncbi:hypothetical protein CY35_18G061700 [Sphagnum magellanicum]|nr:hypothetical protein CY35_18G061700 [Sphagnum magellanicum]
MQLETQVEELQQELWEKSRFFQTAELELSDELELGNMQSLLERVEMNMTKRDSQAGNMVEVNELHCQLLRLLFQLEIVDTSSSMEAIQSDWETADVDNQLVQFPGQEMEGVIPVMSRAVMEQKEKIDLSRQQYLAATIAAREPPSEELLTLVGELRKQLEAFLIRPSLMNAIFVTKQC